MRLDSFSLSGAAIDPTLTSLDTTTAPRPRRLLAALGISTAAHALLALMVLFDVLGAGGGFGLGLGPWFGGRYELVMRDAAGSEVALSRAQTRALRARLRW